MLFQKTRALLFLVFIVALFPGLLTAQTATDKGLSPLQVAQIQQVRDVAISPSGAKVAYTVSKQADPREENEPAKDHLFLLDLSSGNTVPFIKTMDVNDINDRSEEHTSELQSRFDLVCRLLLEKKKNTESK